jgi:heterodisulfide reductase subunit B
MINRIMQGAKDSGAECIVTACAMCHMNLEVRCTLKNPVPIFHFSEILSMAFGVSGNKDWFSRHLIDPRPLLKSKGLMAS